MTTSEQAALLAKHRAIEDDGTPGAALYLGDCYTCERSFPCDVHRMAELKDAEIAELRREISEHVLRADSLRAEIRRLEEELELDGRDAVSEAVERIVAALGIAKGATDSHDYDVLTESDSSFYEGVFSGNLEGIDRSIALLRSRDWSKGDADA
jgi:hypothetical protein